MSVEIGKILDGKVAGIMPFGAFVSLPGGKTGLVHISEVALNYVKQVSDHLNENDEVRVKVVNIDDKGKISLSIKKALLEERKNKPEQPKGPIRPAEIDWTASKQPLDSLSFEDKMTRFKTDSDEKMHDLKRSFDSKRSGGYRRSSGSY